MRGIIGKWQVILVFLLSVVILIIAFHKNKCYKVEKEQGDSIDNLKCSLLIRQVNFQESAIKQLKHVEKHVIDIKKTDTLVFQEMRCPHKNSK